MSDPTSLDPLTAKARQVLKINTEAAYTNLVPRESGSPEAADLLHALSPSDLVEGKIANPADAACLLSALWLWHDYLDESHTISQGVENETGSFWHAIMHRREGDFGNSKYWYAKCRNHPILASMGIQAGQLLAQSPADKAVLKIVWNGWNGPAFVDYVQNVHESPSDPGYALAVSLQQLEWRVLFDHCTRGASGK